MFIKNLILFSLMATSTGAECPEQTVDGLRCVSESTWNYAKCILNDCPEADEACTGVSDGDTCADLQGICTVVTDVCCGGDCKCDLEWFVNCATAGACTDLTCGNTTDDSSARNLFEEELPFVPKTQEEGERELVDGANVACLSEAIRVYTGCVVRECPTADAVCSGTAPDGDTCDDVESTCTKISTDCCPDCATELALLMNCATGDLCGDFQCGSTETGGTTPSPTPATAATPQPTSGSFKTEYFTALVVASLVLAI